MNDLILRKYKKDDSNSLQFIEDTISQMNNPANLSSFMANFSKQLIELPDPATKWKSDIHANQCVFFGQNYVYKIYILPKIKKFKSLIRHAFAKVYSSIGLDWHIYTMESDNYIIDIERREYLEVMSGEWNDSILQKYAYILDLVEKELDLNAVFNNLKASGLKELKGIRLVRNCVPKTIDYAIYKDYVILLDDEDFCVTLFKDNDLFYPSYKGGKPIYCYKNGNDKYYLATMETDSLLSMDDRAVSHVEEQTYKYFLDLLPEDYFGENGKSENLYIAPRLASKKDYYFIHTASYLNRLSRDTIDVALSTVRQDTRKSFQYELWEECNSHCSFCYLGKDNIKTSNERKLISLINLHKILDNFDSLTYNNVSIIGGEFFQGQIDNEYIEYLFFEAFKKIFALYNDNKIDSIWLTATLTIGNQAQLYKLLDMADKYSIKPKPDIFTSGFWLCTSWDTKGRFHTPQMKNNWEYHMKNISKIYPNVKKNTTIILTEPFIDSCLNKEFDTRKFCDDFNTTLFFKQPGVFSKNNDIEFGEDFEENMKTWEREKARINQEQGFNFFPPRSKLIKCFYLMKENDITAFEKLFNIKYRSDELHRNFNDSLEDVTLLRDKSDKQDELAPFHLKCGHVCYYACYSDSDKCCLCDKYVVKDY